MQRVGPALNRVGHHMGDHGRVGTQRRQRRQLRHVGALHGKSDAAAAEQQIECLAKCLEPVDIGEGAIVDARMLVEDRLAAELQAAHGRQHFAPLRRRKRGADHLVQAAQPADACEAFRRDVASGKRRERGVAKRGIRIMHEMHVANPANRLRPSLAAPEFMGIAGIPGNRYEVLEAVGGMGNGQHRAIHG